MEEEIGLAIVSIFFFIVLYVGMIALGMFLTFLIIKWAINKSKVNENLEGLRQEIQRLNFYLHASQKGGAGSAPQSAPPSAPPSASPSASPSVPPAAGRYQAPQPYSGFGSGSSPGAMPGTAPGAAPGAPAAPAPGASAGTQPGTSSGTSPHAPDRAPEVGSDADRTNRQDG